MSIQGSTLSHPFEADRRGTLRTIATKREIIEQSIRAIMETRQGERVMMPDYGMPDFIFAVIDAGFGARVAWFIEQQIRKYEPLVAVEIIYTERGSTTPRNLVFPTWTLARAA
jgi:phage baseplate assembly protein W